MRPSLTIGGGEDERGAVVVVTPGSQVHPPLGNEAFRLLQPPSGGGGADLARAGRELGLVGGGVVQLLAAGREEVPEAAPPALDLIPLAFLW